MSVTRYPNAYDMLDMNTSSRNLIAHPFSFMPAFRVLREKARMRGYEIKQLSLFDPLSPTLSRKERGFMGQQ